MRTHIHTPLSHTSPIIPRNTHGYPPPHTRNMSTDRRAKANKDTPDAPKDPCQI